MKTKHQNFYYLYMLFLLFGVSCSIAVRSPILSATRNMSSSTVMLIPTRQIESTPIPNETSPTVSIQVTQQPEATKKLPLVGSTPLVVINPQVIKRCPVSRQVSVPDLGIDSKSLFIVSLKGEDKNGLYTIRLSDLSMQLIPDTNEDGRLVNFKSVSPNGNWLLFYKRPFDQKNGTIWLYSLESKSQQEIYRGSMHISAAWFTNGDIFIHDAEIGEYFLVDPITLEKKRLTIIDPNISRTIGAYDELGFLMMKKDFFGMVYSQSDSEDHFYLYNNTSGLTSEILSWLKLGDWAQGDTTKILRQTLFWFDQHDLANVVVERQYGFDFATGLDLKMLESNLVYSNVMRSIRIPDDYSKLNITWSPANLPYFAFERQIQSEAAGPSLFYLFDYQSLLLYDYCLDRAGEYDPKNEVGSLPTTLASPDQRFLAWTNRHLSSNTPPYNQESIILEIATGRISHLPGVEVLGWGKMP